MEEQELLEEQCDVYEAENEGRLVPVERATHGCAVSFYLDNKRRHALCLAVIGDEVLIEMVQAGNCRLFTGVVQEVIPKFRGGVATATVVVGKVTRQNYRTLSKRWLRELVATGQSWKGEGKGGSVAPSPSDLLKGQLDLF